MTFAFETYCQSKDSLATPLSETVENMYPSRTTHIKFPGLLFLLFVQTGCSPPEQQAQLERPAVASTVPARKDIDFEKLKTTLKELIDNAPNGVAIELSAEKELGSDEILIADMPLMVEIRNDGQIILTENKLLPIPYIVIKVDESKRGLLEQLIEGDRRNLICKFIGSNASGPIPGFFFEFKSFQ